MLARAGFDQFASANAAVSHAGLLRAIGKLPPRRLHALISTVARGETWLRWPLRTLNMLDGVDDTFRRIDPDGARFGLTPAKLRRFRRNLLYNGIADLAVLLSGIDKPGFREGQLTVEGAPVLERQRESGPGAIVVGFRLGVYPVIPLALGALGYDVAMIVGGRRLIRAAQTLGEEFAPEANGRIEYMSAQDPLVLARSLQQLNAGGVVSTLMELSPIKYAKTTPVRFLDWTINVAYGIPYLSAMTGRPVIPALLLSENGARFRLRFLDPLTAPARDRASILAATQALYGVLEEQVLRYPEQWVGWTILESHLGIDLGRPVPLRMPAVS
jgi:hypothetical protein